MKFNEEFKKEILNEVKKELIKELKEELLKDIFKKETKGERVSYKEYYGHNYKLDNVLFNSYEEAQNVLREMYDIKSKYAVLTVNDFYELAGVTGSYEDNRYGWYDLGDVKIEERNENYYYLNMPEPKRIN